MQDYDLIPCWVSIVNKGHRLPESTEGEGGRPKKVICISDHGQKEYKSIRQCMQKTGWPRKDIIAGEHEGWQIRLFEADIDA